jgi:hypothetical protein
LGSDDAEPINRCKIMAIALKNARIAAPSFNPMAFPLNQWGSPKYCRCDARGGGAREARRAVSYAIYD